MGIQTAIPIVSVVSQSPAKSSEVGHPVAIFHPGLSLRDLQRHSPSNLPGQQEAGRLT